MKTLQIQSVVQNQLFVGQEFIQNELKFKAELVEEDVVAANPSCNVKKKSEVLIVVPVKVVQQVVRTVFPYGME